MAAATAADGVEKGGGSGGEGWERRGSRAQAGAAELSRHGGSAEEKGERPGARGRLRRHGPGFVPLRSVPAARANNSSYNHHPPPRSRARPGLLRPSYCLDTCQ